MIALKNGISILSSKDDGDLFWIKMGKFFASKEVRKEFDGYPLNNGDSHVWLVIIKKEEVISFLGISLEKANKKEVWITEMYTIPECRQKNHASKTFDEAMKLMYSLEGIENIKVIAHPNSYSNVIFKKHKFETERTKGEYIYYNKRILK